MKGLKTIIICTVLVLAVFSMGCAKPPTEEMNNAAEAVTRAENDNDAVTYAANSVARARDALARMHEEVASKRYDAAKSYAAEAISIAERAISEGRAGAVRARNETSAMISDLRPLLNETEQGIISANSAGLDLDFEALARDFDIARSNIDQASAALSGNRFDDAQKLCRAARSDLNGINQKLSNAAIAVSRKK